ncbi:VanW family protein [Streptomyces phaeofaciens JCM 4814]|uniref:Vanomycin resistance protein VanB n=1 Tax=Streptomyces phaeofaciens TaxID=68254 RepID=A0A918M1P7_9ACTN|nr:VanW family protein [Streptomyces phaeofaciens]GGT95110.1 vanomycin resistance protein VanB [Streptomyces phaeofaciens]
MLLRSTTDDTAEGPAGHRGHIRKTAIATGAVAIVVGGLYVAGLVATGDDISTGTRVEGIDIGGLSRAEAADRLASAAPAAWKGPIPVTIGDETTTIDPASAGLTVDARATAERAADPSRDPFTVIGRLFSSGDRDIEPVVSFDGTRAQAAVTAAAKEHDRQVLEGAVAFKDGRAVVTQPHDGQKLDTDKAVEMLRAAYPAADGVAPVALPVSVTRPHVQGAELSRFVTEFAKPAVSGPVTLTAGDKRFQIPAATLADHLTVKADGGRLTPSLDAQALMRDPAVSRPLDTVTGEPVEARLGVRDGKVVVEQDGRPGRTVSAEALGRAVEPLLTKEGATARTGAVAATVTPPKLTAQTLARLGITEQMSTFTVNFPTAPYRTTNIGRAVELINGSVVQPGEVWSFNRTVGERTEANGFVDGTMIMDGQYRKAPGGGVSAVATTVYNALFFAGVEPLEHGAHSFYIERYPAGREATVAWGTLDLKFRNDSGKPIYIKASSTDSSVTVSFLGTKKYDSVTAVAGPRTNTTPPKERKDTGETCEVQEPLEGFDIKVDRVFANHGVEVNRETFGTHYTPRDRVVCD